VTYLLQGLALPQCRQLRPQAVHLFHQLLLAPLVRRIDCSQLLLALLLTLLPGCSDRSQLLLQTGHLGLQRTLGNAREGRQQVWAG
jgi:hypothetical protein